MPLVISVNTKYGHYQSTHLFHFVLFIRDVCRFDWRHNFHNRNVVCLKDYHAQ